MTQVVMKEKTDDNGKLTKVMLENVYFMYVKIGKQKAPIFAQKDLPLSDVTEWEQTLDVLVDEDTADRLEELFPRSSVKKLSKAQLMKKLGLEEGEEGELPYDAKKYWVFKASQKLQRANGTPVDARLLPKAVEIVDGKGVDITYKKSIGNMSRGGLLLKVSYNKTFKCNLAYPSMLKIVDLIEWASGDSVDEDTMDFLGVEVEFDEPEEAEEHSEDTSTDPDDDLDEDDDDDVVY